MAKWGLVCLQNNSLYKDTPIHHPGTWWQIPSYVKA